MLVSLYSVRQFKVSTKVMRIQVSYVIMCKFVLEKYTVSLRWMNIVLLNTNRLPYQIHFTQDIMYLKIQKDSKIFTMRVNKHDAHKSVCSSPLETGMITNKAEYRILHK